jgi:YggT family protein
VEIQFLAQFLATFLNLFKWLLLARILLSWFPTINWHDQPWRGLNEVTEPVMAPFRRLIPPIGGLDLSPIILFLVLNMVIGLLGGVGAGA